MENQLFTLSKIFTERILRIPDYQRGYAWTNIQLNDFWNDIEQIKENSNHYTGVLTLEEVPEQIYKQWADDLWIIESKNFQPYYIVDGQQRLTTSIILIQSIINHLDEISQNILNYTSKDEISKKFIFESKDNGISRSYIFGYENDNPSYDYLVSRIFGERIPTSSTVETIYTKNLQDAKLFFEKKLKNLKTEELGLLYKKVTQQLLFNHFTISKEIDVCVAFETMNNRGKPLSYLELLKNRLIYLSIKLEISDYDRVKLREAINLCWKDIYHHLGRNSSKPLDDDTFLSTHYIIYFGKDLLDVNNKEEIFYHTHRLFVSLRRGDYHNDLLHNKFISKNLFLDDDNIHKITLSKIYAYVNSLQDSVVTWFKIWNPADSEYTSEEIKWLEKIRRLDMPGSNTIHIVLILSFFKNFSNSQQRVKFLKSLERLLFISTTLSQRSFGFDFIGELMELILFCSIDNNQNHETIIKKINDLTSTLIEDSENGINKYFKNIIKSQNFYRWEGIRYFLYEYNLYLLEQSKSSHEKIIWDDFKLNNNDFISIEHIYPQKPKDKEWKEIYSDYGLSERKLLQNSLGNLLPLSRAKNSSLSNRKFEDKINGKENSFIGYRYGCYAENEVCKENIWNASAILKRGLKLLDFMEKRWGIKLGSREDKIDILGLNFIENKLKSGDSIQ